MEIQYKHSITNIQEPHEIDRFDGEEFLGEDQNDDALSLCDLPLDHDGTTNDVVAYPSSPCSDAFEFSISDAENYYETLRSTDHTILFCGKSIPCRSTRTTPFSPASLKSSDPLSHWKSESFHYDQLRTTKTSEIRVHVTTRSSSVRLPETGTRRYPHQSSSNGAGKSSRKHYNLFIGLAKFPPRMELDDMRRRQSRRRAVAPVLSGGDRVPAAGGGESTGSSGKGHWSSLLMPLKFRSNLVRALARASFGCKRHV